MHRVFLCLLAVLLFSGGRAAPPGPAGCAAELARISEDIQQHDTEGEAALAGLVSRLDRLVERYGDPDTACGHAALYRIVRLEMLRGRMESIISRTDRFDTGTVHEAHPDDDARIYYARSQALVQTGRQTDAQRALSAAATLVPRLQVKRAVLVLSTLGVMAQTQGEWGVAEASFNRAGQVIRDSAATRTDEQRVVAARMLSKQAFLYVERIGGQAGPGARVTFARRLLAVADSGLALLRSAVPQDPSARAVSASFVATMETDAAFGEAVLGRHERASRRLDTAYGLVSPAVIEVADYVLTDYWLRRSQVELMAGRIAEAEAAAGPARETCRDVSDIACTLEAEQQTALVLDAAGRWHDAEAHYRAAAGIADIVWEGTRLQDWGTSRFAAMQRPYRGLSHVLLRQGRTAEAFTVLDGSRARALRDILTWQTARTHLPLARRARVDSLMTVVQEQRVALLADTLLPDEAGVIRGAITNAQQQIEREADLDASALAPLDIAAVQRALRQQRRTLVSYLVGEDSTDVYVLTPDTLVARTVPIGWYGVQGLLAAAGGAWASGVPEPAVRLAPLAALYDRLLRPVAGLLPPGDGLVVIPDGPVADLPFGALLTAPPAASGQQPFLVRSRALSTDLAASLVLDAGEPRPDFAVDLLAFGRSRFDAGGGRFRSRSGPLLANLPNVATEIRGVEAFAGRRTAALDDEATEARFEAEAGTARVVHIASHAEVDPAFPLNSRIYLWDDPEAADDGILHLFELQALSMPADLVVLSGCSTAAGETRAGEGTIGLQYAVRAAGARAAVATLWPVEDAATGELVESFYAGLADGLPADRALQRAQVAYLDTHDGAEASPYFWAATVLSGSPAPVPLGTPTSAWPWAAAAAAAAGGLAWAARRRSANA